MGRITRSYNLLRVSIPLEFEEAVSNFLIEAGSRGVKLEQNHSRSEVTGYFQSQKSRPFLQRTKRYLEGLAELFRDKFSYNLSHQIEKKQDWSVTWRKSFKPVYLGKKLVVLPAWYKKKLSYPVVIKIIPQMAFGTGTHPTTQSCLLALAKLVKPKDKVLDLGTGSGILAIAAAKLGAGMVLAVDKDRMVTESARKHFRLNRVGKKVKLKIGSLDKIQKPASFDLGVANLTGSEIFEVFDNLKNKIKVGGNLIISGWTKEESRDLTGFLSRRRMNIVERMDRKGWVTLICKK